MPITRLEQMLAAVQSRPKKRLAAAFANDAHTIQAVHDAVRRGIVDATLVGDEKIIRERCGELGIDPAGFQIVDEPQDAKAAAPMLAPGESVPQIDTGSDNEEGRASLAAVPPLDDSGPPTQAWQADPMTIFGQGGDKAAGAKLEAGSSQFTGGPDWIA